MNKNIIKKAIIAAILITVFSLLITKWLDYKKQKDYELKRQDMIQTLNKPSKDCSTESTLNCLEISSLMGFVDSASSL